MTDLDARTGQQLLADILENPADDAVRLIYADWLEEHAGTEIVPCPVCSPYANDGCPDCDGQGTVRLWPPKKAWGVPRMTCETCKGSGKFPTGYHPERDPASGRHEGGWTNCKECNGGGPRYCKPGYVKRSDGRAERAEFIRLQIDLDNIAGMGNPPEDVFKYADRLEIRQTELLRQGYVNWSPFPLEWHKKHHQAISYRRGFVHLVRCPLQAWLDHGEAVCAAQPIERVELTDKRPGHLPGGVGDRGGWWWEPGICYDAPHQVPFDIPDAAGWKCGWYGGIMVYVFETERDATDALSAACIEWARHNEESK